MNASCTVVLSGGDAFAFLPFLISGEGHDGRSKGCGKSGRMLQRDQPVNVYHSAFLCSPVVSVWDCIVRKMREEEAEKKEEQQRLDEDSAAIAEAVALHVLLGEDSSDSGEVMLNKEEGFNRWDCASNFNLFMGGGGACLPHQANTNRERMVTNAYRGGCEWAAFGNGDWSFTYGACGRDVHASHFENGGWGNEGLSADLIAAQAVSALQIREDAEVDKIVLNRMLRG
ncbi:hypothetical protein V6N12_057992 [Hibiscus sabdariffa]|uniref:Uncharacterized protein n=1 Tax=Hibiscus sabdariffa TaxID=183260 RepID=A0ABR1ZE36_9ROSI